MKPLAAAAVAMEIHRTSAAVIRCSAAAISAGLSRPRVTHIGNICSRLSSWIIRSGRRSFFHPPPPYPVLFKASFSLSVHLSFSPLSPLLPCPSFFNSTLTSFSISFPPISHSHLLLLIFHYPLLSSSKTFSPPPVFTLFPSPSPPSLFTSSLLSSPPSFPNTKSSIIIASFPSFSLLFHPSSASLYPSALFSFTVFFGSPILHLSVLLFISLFQLPLPQLPLLPYLFFCTSFSPLHSPFRFSSWSLFN